MRAKRVKLIKQHPLKTDGFFQEHGGKVFEVISETKAGYDVRLDPIYPNETGFMYKDEVEVVEYKPLCFNRISYWRTLGVLSAANEIPTGLADMLRSLLSSFVHNTAAPEAKPCLIEMSKAHLLGGILLEMGTRYEQLYEVMVYQPEAGVERKPFFALVPKYPQMELKHLSKF